MSLPRVGVLTTVHGEHHWLLHQIGGLSLNRLPPTVHVMVAMADATLGKGRLPVTTDRWRSIVRTARTDLRQPLPVGAASNLAAESAIEAGAEILVFVDVDLIPGPRMLQTFATRIAADDHPGPMLWIGQRRYLPPPDRPGQDVQRLEQLAATVSHQPLWPPDHDASLAEAGRFEPGAMAITAADFISTDGFVATRTAGATTVTETFATSVEDAGGSIRCVGGAPAYQQTSRVLELVR